MDDLQTRVLNATQTINTLTGYTAIETIKATNEALEAAHHASQSRLHTARQAYKSLTSHRAATQREVTTLLARKDSWSPPDLERFTTLYRADHELEAQVAAASAELTEAEADEARLSAELNAGILKRYHEEQIWSDRIRRQSTWGTWGLMGVNVLLFLGLQFVAEPWRRKRLVRSIAEGERGVLEEVREELGRVREVLDGMGARREEVLRVEQQQQPVAVEEPVAAVEAEPEPVMVEEAVPVVQSQPEAVEPEPFLRAPWKEVLADPAMIKAAAADLCSERRIDVRMRDISLLALEGAAAGAAIMGGLVFALLRPR
ncbi:Mdm33 family-domain-containing protein [Podospora conica]|nr:Mdm33 family-domain-containing protein [Schizothecium conicum]